MKMFYFFTLPVGGGGGGPAGRGMNIDNPGSAAGVGTAGGGANVGKQSSEMRGKNRFYPGLEAAALA